MRKTVRLLRPAVAVLLAAAASGCASRGGGGGVVVDERVETIGPAPVGDFSLDRGGWLVGRTTGLWTVTVPGEGPGAPPRRIGYVQARAHRQVRGGPSFTVYEVYGLDRENALGLVDSLGNAKRFRRAGDGRIEVEDAGNNTLAFSVGAVLGVPVAVTLEATTERHLAFEALDANKDGKLDAAEFPAVRAERGPDRNRDGKLDLDEFLAADRY